MGPRGGGKRFYVGRGSVWGRAFGGQDVDSGADVRHPRVGTRKPRCSGRSGTGAYGAVVLGAEGYDSSSES